MAGRDIQAFSVIATKMASGTVQIQLQTSLDGLNPSGDFIFCIVMPAADVTSLNTNVNGGAAGATRTFTYAQNTNQGDYSAPDGSGNPVKGFINVAY